jgi:hypothetical protein
MAIPYKSLRKIAPYATRAAPAFFYALGFVTALVSTIYLATRYMDNLPGPSASELEEKRKKASKSIDDKLKN